MPNWDAVFDVGNQQPAGAPSVRVIDGRQVELGPTVAAFARVGEAVRDLSAEARRVAGFYQRARRALQRDADVRMLSRRDR